MKHVVVGTAGHIDHGKTNLVKALTGINTDRFKEEQERGITIDIGFAPLALGPELTVGFVDVPGHEKFVKNMLAGIWGIDLVLLVIAADESVKPQTREHFEICSLLDVKRGLIALTKIDLTDPELQELVTLEIRDFVRGSFLEEAPIIPVSSKTGAGLDSLKDAIAAAAARFEPGRPSALLRLPVDRAFSMRGFGTVVTGTLVSGSLAEGEEVSLYPAGHRGRVRGLQVHGDTVTAARAGQRTAVNIGGIEVGQVQRGDVLGRPGQMQPSSILDVRLRLLPDAPAPLKNLARVRFHQGTSELLARVRLLDPDISELPPGGECFAQIRLEKQGMAMPDDRFVIRRYSPTITIGGGVVLDAHPVKHKGMTHDGLLDRLAGLEEADLRESIRIHLDNSPAGADIARLSLRIGRTVRELQPVVEEGVRAGGLLTAGEGATMTVISSTAVETLSGRILAELQRYHHANPLRPGMPLEELRERVLGGAGVDVSRMVIDRMTARGEVRIEKDAIGLAAHQVRLTPDDEKNMKKLEEAYRHDGLNPRDADELAAALGIDPARAEKLLHLLLAAGGLVRIRDGRVFHAEAIEELKHRLWSLRPRKTIIDIGSFKELTGTSRKNAIPLLEHLDAVRVTRRVGSDREILPPPGG